MLITKMSCVTEPVRQIDRMRGLNVPLFVFFSVQRCHEWLK